MISRPWIIDQDLASERTCDSGWQHSIAIILPVREIRCKQQHLLRWQLIEQSGHHIRIIWCIERLYRQADVIANDLHWRPVDPGHLETHAAPELGEPPEKRWQPRHTGLDQHRLQLRELHEHALRDQASHLRMETQRLSGIILQIITRPP